MGSHDLYGKAVFRQAAGLAFHDTGSNLLVSYGDKGGARIDGVVGKNVAVEIESRVPKQVRGAVLDLICHPYPKKLLVLLPAWMSNPTLCSQQCQFILGRFIPTENYRVVLLAGNGATHLLDADAHLIRNVLLELGYVP